MDSTHLSKRTILEMLKSRQITSDQAYRMMQELQEGGRAPQAQPAFYRSEWVRADGEPTGTERVTGRTLIFDADEELFRTWKQRQAKREGGQAAVLLVRPGARFQDLGDGRYEINPREQGDYDRLAETLFQEDSEPLNIVHLWSKGEVETAGQLETGVYSLFHLAKALLARNVNAYTRLLHLYQDGNPLGAAVGGFVKSLHQEDSRHAWKAVGVASTAASDAADIMEQEWKRGTDDLEIRYEGGARFVKRFVEDQPQKGKQRNSLPLKQNGVYLITGGAGGLGLIFAEYLAKQVQAKLVLVGRSAVNPRLEQKLRELEALGAETLYLQADLSKKSDVDAVIAKSIDRFQSLDGILHSAGVIRDAFIVKKTKQDMIDVLASKIFGTVHLDEATRELDLEVFVLFSSIASVFGNMGQCDYAFGNSFLDHFAAMRSKVRGGKTLSINWPLWEDGGMQISQEEREWLAESSGLEMLPTLAGVAGFEAALRADRSQYVVAYGRQPKLGQTFERGLSKQEPVVHVQAAEPVAVAVDKAVLVEKAEAMLKSEFSALLKMPVEQIDVNTAFQDYGIDSILIKKFNNNMERTFAALPKTLLFEHQNLRDLKEYFVAKHEPELVKLFGLGEKPAEATVAKAVKTQAPTPPQSSSPSREKRSGKGFPRAKRGAQQAEPQDQKQAHAQANRAVKDSDIAIIGVSGRYPGAKNLDEYWANLAAGRDSVTEIPASRWNWSDYYHPDPEQAREGKAYSKWGAFLENADHFDPLFFNISPKEAELIDPQERLFLQASWSVLEDAGYTRKQLNEMIDGKRRTSVGVFVGVTTNTYLLWGPDEWARGNAAMPNSMPWSIANRVSFVFNFNGPSLPVDTACSSSLTAIHMACESLMKGDCQVAIAGGVNLYLHPSKYVSLCQMRMLSATGKCHSFGADGDGFVPGEGVGAVLLKPLRQAIADGDHIYGVIKGTAINHGGSTNGYTVPSPIAQADVISDALRKADIDARTVSFIEAHGTGTSLGDPIEIAGLNKAFGAHTSDLQFCSVGSVKTNIGHLEAAAGIAALTKVLLQMKHRQIAPSLHAQTPNPNIDFERTPFYVQHELADWEAAAGVPRRAGISSFGAGGANAHILVEEFVMASSEAREEDGKPQLVVLSARNDERLRAYAGEMANCLRTTEGLSLADVAYTLQVGREPMAKRLAFVVRDREELIHLLNEYHVGKEVSANGEGELQEAANRWLSGAEVDWAALHEGSLPKRISLPTYPFESERYWLQQVDKKKPLLEGGAAKLHPLVDSNVSTLREQKFLTRMTGQEFYLADHVVAGRKILPGVAYVEMARAAAEIAGESKVARIRDVMWGKPVSVAEEPVDVLISLQPVGVGVAYEVSTTEEDGQRTLHAQGAVSFEVSEASVVAEYADLDAIRSRCSEIREAQDAYGHFEKVGFAYGSKFKSIQRLFLGERELLSELKLPEGLEDELDSFLLHPSLLDGALQSVVGFARADDDMLLLPFSIGEIEIHDALLSTRYAHLVQTAEQTQGTRTYQVALFDAEGKVLVRVKDFTLREFKQQSLRSSVVYYGAEWQPASLPETARPTGTVVVFDQGGEMADAVQAQAGNVVRVKPGSGYRKLADGSYEVAPGAQEDYKQLLQALAESGQVPQLYLHAWAEEQTNLPGDLERGAYSLLALSQALMAQKVKGNVRVVTMYRTKQGEIHPAWAALSGFAHALRRENSKMNFKIVELASGANAQTLSFAAEAALRELAAGDETEVRYEQETRYVQHLQEYVPESADLANRTESKPLPLKQQGVYLLTGGVGGLGLLFAEHLAKNYQAKLVLTGRSELDAKRKQQLAELEGFGAEVLYVRADVTDKQDVDRLIAETKSRFGKLNGIVHSAGVLRDSFVLKKTREDMEAVLAPKVYGTVNLDEATRNEALDFFVLFSSVSALMGNIGQSDYAFANRFMDHYAARRAVVQAGRSLSINWPYWKSGGMNVDEATQKWFVQTIGMVPLQTESGVQAFEEALTASHAQLLVLEGNEQAIRKALAPKASESKAEQPEAVQPQAQAAAAVEVTHEADATDQPLLREKTEAYLKGILSGEIRLPVHKIASHEPLEHYGIDSIMIMALTRELEKEFGDLPKTLFFEYQNIGDLAGYFMEAHRDQLTAKIGDTPKPKAKAQAPASQAVEQKAAAQKAEPLRSRFLTAPTTTAPVVKKDDVPEAIAIIGVSGTYPMAHDLDEFLENFRNARDCVSEIPKDRWDHSAIFDPDKTKKGKTYSKWGGFLDDIDKFDPLFFNISPKEAELMDPQERLFLQSVYHTMEDAGYTKDVLSKSAVGVFVGVMYGHYQLYGAEESLKGNSIALSSSYASIANRVSYCFNFNGPSVAMDTMCSSSLTAIHFACESLRRGESEVAVAGGVNISTHPNKYILLSQGKFTASDGRCRSFGEGGDGYVPGEGVGAVLLKPLSKAIADGDRIYAVIKGSSLNHGGKTNGYTVPNPTAQGTLITDTLKRAQINPRTISYIEAHGTGTSLGDPIEIAGLARAFRDYTSDKQFCSIGSAKSNIGHLESAAGIAAVTKVLLQFKHRQLMPSIHSDILNPHINFEDTPFYVQRTLAEWKRPVIVEDGVEKEVPRRAGISSFGAGGSNAHLILEEYEAPQQTSAEEPEEPQVILLSAKSRDRLTAYASKYLNFLQKSIAPSAQHEPLNQADVFAGLQRELVQTASGILQVEESQIDLSESLDEYGLDPVGWTEFVKQVNERCDVLLDLDAAMQAGTLQALAENLYETNRERYEGSLQQAASANERIELSLADLAYTLQTGREAMDERLALVVSSVEELADSLNRFLRGETLSNAFTGSVKNDREKVELLIDGKAGEEFIRMLIQERALHKIASLWVYGADIDWSLLQEDGQAKRISLPVYPFAKERYWVPGADETRNLTVTAQARTARLHPLVERNISDLKEQKYATVLSARDYYLADHTVAGRHVLPGAAYLEMARAAGELAGGDAVRKLTNIAWWQPISVEAEQEVEVAVSLYPADEAIEYEVWSDDASGRRIVHGQGQLLFAEGADAEGKQEAATLDLDAVKSRAVRIKTREEVYDELEAVGFGYGSGFRPLQEVLGGEGEVLSLLSIPQELRDSFADYVLHPTLLDGAFQTAGMYMSLTQSAGGQAYLPFALGEVEIFNPLVQVCYVHVTEKTNADAVVRKFDIQLVDEEGQVLLRMTDFSVRAFRDPEAVMMELLEKLDSGDLSVDDAEQLIGVMLNG